MIDYHPKLSVFVSVKGHDYQRDAFAAMLESMDELTFTTVEQPASQVFFNPEQAQGYDAFLLYDMPGIDFSVSPPALVAPDKPYRQRFLELLEQGRGFVFVHHAIAGWPLWPEYAEIVGGRFLYLPDTLRGQQRQDSGYRHEVHYQASVVADHPVTAGVKTQFDATDELYLYEVFESDVIPLLSSNYSFDREHFYSAQEAVLGRMHSNANWPHPGGSNLIGWVKHYRNSPIVYLQPGDNSVAYNNEEFRRLLCNALNWVASNEAQQWARHRNQGGR